MKSRDEVIAEMSVDRDIAKIIADALMERHRVTEAYLALSIQSEDVAKLDYTERLSIALRDRSEQFKHIEDNLQCRLDELTENS